MPCVFRDLAFWAGFSTHPAWAGGEKTEALSSLCGREQAHVVLCVVVHSAAGRGPDNPRVVVYAGRVQCVMCL